MGSEVPPQPEGLRPRLELDDLLVELQAQLDTIRTTRDRMHALLDAVLAIGSDLDLQTVLRRIVEAAVVLADAEYGALGVIGEGDQLSQFLTVGIDDELHQQIGALPRGRGILGLLIREPHAIRLRDLSQHEASYGFPPHHPPMRSFLGVPVRVRDEVFGNLYLTEKRGQAEFDEADVSIVEALATAAGVAVENARLYQAARQREHWLEASSEVMARLLSGEDPGEVLELVAERCCALADADLAMITLPHGEELVIEIAVGAESRLLRGRRLPIGRSLTGVVFHSGKQLNVSDVRTDDRFVSPIPDSSDYGPAIMTPLVADGGVQGVITVANLVGGRSFGDLEASMIEGFAGQAAVALKLAEQRRETERLGIYEDRDRIARDLHDLVIQRLFANGMQLESTIRLMEVPEAVDRVRRVVDDLDTTIKEIRSTIYALQSEVRASDASLRSRLLAESEDASPSLGFSPALRFEGLIDTAVPPSVEEHLLAVLREALSNVARHAKAERVDVSVAVGGDGLTLTVRDDGVGLGTGSRRSGLRNLADRAAQLGGAFVIGDAPGGGTELVWQVPLGGIAS